MRKYTPRGMLLRPRGSTCSKYSRHRCSTRRSNPASPRSAALPSRPATGYRSENWSRTAEGRLATNLSYNLPDTTTRESTLSLSAAISSNATFSRFDEGRYAKPFPRKTDAVPPRTKGVSAPFDRLSLIRWHLRVGGGSRSRLGSKKFKNFAWSSLQFHRLKSAPCAASSCSIAN